MTKEQNKNLIAVVLSGGGSRAAYQAGALRAISVLIDEPNVSPFQIYTGASAGSINATFMASRADDFAKATQALWDLWAQVRTEDVLKTDALTFSFISTRLIKDLTFGGAAREVKSTSLVNNQPLQKLIEKQINFRNIDGFIRAGNLLNGVAINAINYRTTTSVCFYDRHEPLVDWNRPGRISVQQKIQKEHVLASSAIPVFFPPQKIGNTYYGDGSIRAGAPLSPAIHLGASKMVVIGVNYHFPPEQLRSINKDPMDSITLVEIIGTMMDALFSEGMEADLLRLNRINRTLTLLSDKHPEGLRPIPFVSIQPTRDINQFANNILKDVPFIYRYFLQGIGVDLERGNELMSYLSFESKFTSRLLEMGYDDTMAKKSEILALFAAK